VAGATQVDFYLLGAADPRARLATACRLAEKACDQRLRVAVRTASPSETAELDELMWTFSDRSFVPHAVWPAEPAVAEHTPVLIASGALPESHCDVLINLALDGPAEPARFARICEVVGADEEHRRRARQRWRGYTEAGLAPAKHDL
jgi:DNA polymerase-3 subunit chi